MKPGGRRDGVGRALVRRITGMVATKSEEDRNDNLKTKSFAKEFKLGPLFRKETRDQDDCDVKKDDINLKRRPATLGLPKAGS